MLKRTDGDRNGPGVSRALTLGFDIAVGVGLFSFGGYWLDQRRGGGVGWTLAGMCIGLAYAGYEIWRALRAVEDADKARKAGGSAGGDDSLDRKRG